MLGTICWVQSAHSVELVPVLLVAASPVFDVFAYVFVGSSGILAPSTAHPAELSFCFRGLTGDHGITVAELR